jgi:DNA-binding response OmpR family regulator
MTSSPVPRILVIDDDPTIVEVLSVGLRQRGYDVCVALSSVDALRLLTKSRPDLVLLDIGLPGMNGVELLRRIQSIEPVIKIIVVTANRDVLLAREVLERGVLAYVDKPFDFSYLMRVVGVALQ